MSSLFKFQQFNVRHDRCAMKVGTDGVLLGAWANVQGAQQILDIGTGSGLIALMLAQRTNGQIKIDAVEPDQEACKDAMENFSESPWNRSINLHALRIQDFEPGRLYDLIVTNPPYFTNSLKPPSANREIARHANFLQFEELVGFCHKHLSPGGRLAIILPAVEGEKFISLMDQVSLPCTRQWYFRSRLEKTIERYLLEFSNVPHKKVVGELVLHGEGNTWSDEYKELTKDFYLKG